MVDTIKHHIKILNGTRKMQAASQIFWLNIYHPAKMWYICVCFELNLLHNYLWWCSYSKNVIVCFFTPSVYFVNKCTVFCQALHYLTYSFLIYSYNKVTETAVCVCVCTANHWTKMVLLYRVVLGRFITILRDVIITLPREIATIKLMTLLPNIFS